MPAPFDEIEVEFWGQTADEWKTTARSCRFEAVVLSLGPTLETPRLVLRPPVLADVDPWAAHDEP
jgi:hypothetical protein